MRIIVLMPQTNWTCQSWDQRLSFFVLYNYSATFYVFSKKYPFTSSHLSSGILFIANWTFSKRLFSVNVPPEAPKQSSITTESHFTVASGEEGCWLLEIFDISEFHDHKDTRAGPGLLGEIQSQVAKDVTVSATLYSQFSIHCRRKEIEENREKQKNYIFFLSWNIQIIGIIPWCLSAIFHSEWASVLSWLDQNEGCW